MRMTSRRTGLLVRGPPSDAISILECVRETVMTSLLLPTRYADILGASLLAEPDLRVWAITRDGEVTLASDSAVRDFACGSALGRGVAGPADVTGRTLESLGVPELVRERMRRIADRIAREGAPIVGEALWAGRRWRSRFIPVTETRGGVGEMLVVTTPAPLALDDELAPDQPIDRADYACLGERLASLTRRELEVLAYFGQGLSIQEIATRLCRAPKTIRRFQEGLSHKLGVSGRTGLSLLARDLGLTPAHAEVPWLN